MPNSCSSNVATAAAFVASPPLLVTGSSAALCTTSSPCSLAVPAGPRISRPPLNPPLRATVHSPPAQPPRLRLRLPSATPPPFAFLSPPPPSSSHRHRLHHLHLRSLIRGVLYHRHCLVFWIGYHHSSSIDSTSSSPLRAYAFNHLPRHRRVLAFARIIVSAPSPPLLPLNFS